MPRFEALMRVVHHETWDVEAASESEARDMIAVIHDFVNTDETGGEVVDWDIITLKPGRP